MSLPPPLPTRILSTRKFFFRLLFLSDTFNSSIQSNSHSYADKQAPLSLPLIEMRVSKLPFNSAPFFPSFHPERESVCCPFLSTCKHETKKTVKETEFSPSTLLFTLFPPHCR
mmetsp:Transcript_5343/g.10573  ORF Transcript_5343/g.10573 Transcript_5343/m.10573 type:complete len:113 (+) Transcript_5343:926-1264(+)